MPEPTRPGPDTRGVLTVADGDGVRLVTFTRPDALNAFNQDLWRAATDVLADAATDDDLRCVVLTGAGRAFTAGADLKEMFDPARFEHEEPGYHRFMEVVEEFPKPLVAAVNGVAVGIGTTILPFCDLVFVSAEARLKMPFISLGVTTEAASSYLLPATVGWQRACQLLYTEPWITPEQAVTWGLALQVCAPDELLATAMDAARAIGALPLAPLVATKRLLNAGRVDAIRAARRREVEAFAPLVQAMVDGG